MTLGWHHRGMQRIFCLLPLFAAISFAQDAKKEIALGRQLAAEFRRTMTPLLSPAAQVYIDDLGARLAAQSGNTPFTYTFALIADDPTALHEPAAFPGGFVFVPSRLILAAKEEDELAGMLAHAIAHIAARHAGIAQSTVPLVFVGGSAGFAIERGNRMAIPTVMLSHFRKFEMEADSLAVRMMSAAGYDAAALVRYLEREQPSVEPTQRMRSALPAPAERLSAIRAAIASLPARAYEPHPRFDLGPAIPRHALP
jgi:predicted Zn-dependent protease